jgi:hypothetical protein
MKTKAINNWLGVFSILWMMVVFVFIHYIVVPRHIVVGSFWLWIFGLLFVQLLPGLLLAIFGMRFGSLAGKICGILAIILFLWFVRYGVVPAVIGYHNSI